MLTQCPAPPRPATAQRLPEREAREGSGDGCVRAQADYLVERYAYYHLRVISIPPGILTWLGIPYTFSRSRAGMLNHEVWSRYMKKHPADDAALAEVHSLSSGLKPLVTWATAAVRGRAHGNQTDGHPQPTGHGHVTSRC